MALTQLDELFMAETMTAEVERFADQSRERSYVDVYDRASVIEPAGEKFTYDEVRFSRDLAAVTGPHSPSKAGTPLGAVLRAGRIYKIAEHVDLPMTLLAYARGLGQQGPDPRGWLSKNLKNLTNKCQRTRNFWAARSLSTVNGSVDLKTFPNMDLPAGGTHVLAYPIGTLASGAPWSTTSTHIQKTEIPRIRKQYRQQTGHEAAIAIASDAVEGYISDNDHLTIPIDRNPTLQQRKIENSFLEGGTVDRLGGLNMKYCRDFYATEAAPDTYLDVTTDADLISVLPAEDMWPEAFARVEGRQFVPTGAITSAAVGDPFSLVADVRGWGAYLELITNPIGLRLHVFWCGNFVHLLQQACLVYDTSP